MATSKLRLGVGLISVGWMGRLHTRSYKAIPERFPELGVEPRLVIAADAVADVAQQAVDHLGYERATTDYREVLADPEVDVVSICAPNVLHKELALAAAAAGKPFWIEKPMGRNLAESAEIARAASDVGLVTSVGFNYRNAPAIAYSRDLIARGELGTITNVRVSFLADYASDPEGALTWRFERDRAGSGVLGDLLSHGFDLATHLVGDIDAVSATTGTYITERAKPASANASHFSTSAGGEKKPVENEDVALVIATFASGAIGAFEASRIAVGPRAEYVIEVYGTEGSLRWDFQRMNELQVSLRREAHHGYLTLYMEPGMGEYARFQPGAGTAMGFDDLKTIEAAKFLTSVLTGEQCGPSTQHGLAAARVVDAVERSAQLKARVSVTHSSVGRDGV
ncbi:Gfo/Idh/MocA family protein [Microbacterium sp. MPKO10]|uniref:Gfo/Idh/MocA family protein n=1 Tax=Microbacterium sp. MPKO10 TaxID=2989818 RepID=UPI0022363A65|nr:Gfo/Idh/MocA family oxidoreductase [Microbacterium sp. MPKO10]MCW4457305.1 Gfo/Idh/MocA family oxidoreductase [Microbacterium sp. MPKO10]